MKKLTIILMLLFACITIYAQDEGVFPIGPVEYKIDPDDPYSPTAPLKEILTWWEQKDSLLLGWQWCAGKTITFKT